MNINLNLYKYFYTVAKNLSFTKAADELVISQPSLSYSIKTLENQLNKKLFVRTTKGIELTEDGEKLYNAIIPLIDAFNDLLEENNDYIGNVSIGVRILFQSSINIMFLKKIKKLYPGVDVDIKIRNSKELFEELIGKKTDIIIDEYNYEDTNENVKSVLLKDEVCKLQIICGAKFKHDTVSLDDLKNKKIVIVGSNKIERDFVKKHGLTNIENVCSSHLVNEMVKDEDTFGLSFSLITRDNNEIKVLNTDFEIPKFEMYVSYLKEKENNKIVQMVSELFSEYTLEEIEKL